MKNQTIDYPAVRQPPDAFLWSLFSAIRIMCGSILTAEFVPGFMDAKKANAEFDAHPISSTASLVMLIFAIGLCSYFLHTNIEPRAAAGPEPTDNG